MTATFYLGTHRPNWLGKLHVPLFVSHRTLRDRRTFPRASAAWVCDSGGFTEVSSGGAFSTSPSGYVAAVRLYSDEVGSLAWAAPQDWMCEPFVLAKTGLTVAEHQRRTVESVLTLRSLAADLPFAPVLQGWTVDDYERCADLYDRAGIDLTAEPIVGVGSVCRRQATGEIGRIFETLTARGFRLHGFGVKMDGLVSYGQHLASADSMAWSFNARHEPALPGCAHKSCANCPRYALRWRAKLIDLLRYEQLALGGAA